MENEIIGWCKIEDGDFSKLIVMEDDDKIKFSLRPRETGTRTSIGVCVSKKDFAQIVKEFIKLHL